MDKRIKTEVYSYIGARMSKSDWLEWPSLSMMRLAAQLAWEGHLPSVKEMTLMDIDLSDIRQDHICKLTSIVTNRVWIYNITPASLDIILESVRCSKLILWNMRLSEPQTQALVTALTERLEDVMLTEDSTLDIQTLFQYNGQGKCLKLMVQIEDDMMERYEERLQRWGAEIGWKVSTDDWLYMERK